MALDRAQRAGGALSDDLEFLAKYLEIEQARFGERLSVRYDFDPDTLDALVPNLLLQPLRREQRAARDCRTQLKAA